MDLPKIPPYLITNVPKIRSLVLLLQRIPTILNISTFSHKLFSAIVSASGTPLSCCHFSVTALNFPQARAE